MPKYNDVYDVTRGKAFTNDVWYIVRRSDNMHVGYRFTRKDACAYADKRTCGLCGSSESSLNGSYLEELCDSCKAQVLADDRTIGQAERTI